DREGLFLCPPGGGVRPPRPRPGPRLWDRGSRLRQPDGARPGRRGDRGPRGVGCRGVALRGEQGGRAGGGRERRSGDYERPGDAEGGWLDWRQDCGVVGIEGVDTRALVRHSRDRGAMRGGIFRADLSEDAARERLEAEPPMKGADLARTVSPAEPVELDGTGPHVVGIDTGIKLSILRQLRERDCRVTLLPCSASAQEVLDRDPDLVFLANGPGDPAALDYVVDTVRELVGKRPVV